MRALIVGDSPDFEPEFLLRFATSFDRVYVTDGAIHKVPSQVKVAVVCGDFDSIDLQRAQREWPHTQFLQLVDQELNDVEKALLLAESEGARYVEFVSILGGKSDQSFANISMMVRHHQRLPLRAFHRGQCVWIVSGTSELPGSLSFECRVGDHVSIIPLSGHAHIDARNLKWPLRNEVLNAGSRGVSNEALGGLVEISVMQGLVVVTADAAA